MNIALIIIIMKISGCVFVLGAVAELIQKYGYLTKAVFKKKKSYLEYKKMRDNA